MADPKIQCPTCYGEGKVFGKATRFLHTAPWLALIFMIISAPSVWVGYQWRTNGYPPMQECPKSSPCPKAEQFASIPKNCAMTGYGPMVCSKRNDKLRIVVEELGRHDSFENIIYLDNPEPLEDGGAK